MNFEGDKIKRWDLQDAVGNLIFAALLIMQEYAKSNKLYFGFGAD
ncbi:MAG: hypothetical protein PHT07_22225 [Paludibacter sp.]|nr:hypothetical protein [Paludibacter sp.]